MSILWVLSWFGMRNENHTVEFENLNTLEYELEHRLVCSCFVTSSLREGNKFKKWRTEQKKRTFTSLCNVHLCITSCLRPRDFHCFTKHLTIWNLIFIFVWRVDVELFVSFVVPHFHLNHRVVIETEQFLHSKSLFQSHRFMCVCLWQPEQKKSFDTGETNIWNASGFELKSIPAPKFKFVIQTMLKIVMPTMIQTNIDKYGRVIASEKRIYKRLTEKLQRFDQIKLWFLETHHEIWKPKSFISFICHCSVETSMLKIKKRGGRWLNAETVEKEYFLISRWDTMPSRPLVSGNFTRRRRLEVNLWVTIKRESNHVSTEFK